MLTAVTEQSKKKCHQYWPGLNKKPIIFDGITVVTQAEEQIDTNAVVNSSAACFNTFLYAVVSIILIMFSGPYVASYTHPYTNKDHDVSLHWMA